MLRCGITAGESEISKGDAGFVKKTILAAREMVLLIEAGKVSFGESNSVSECVCVYVVLMCLCLCTCVCVHDLKTSTLHACCL